MSGQRFYEEGEAEEILRRALHQGQDPSKQVDRQRLLNMAAELGISPDAVAKAEAQLATERRAQASKERELVEREEFKKHRKGKLWSDFSSYFTVNAFLVAIWWFTGHGYFWPAWVLAGWGIALLGDVFSIMFANSDKEFERWQKKQRRRRSKRTPSEAEVDAFIHQLAPEVSGAKLQTIKEVREKFDLSLEEAKDAVDSYFERLDK